VILLNQRTGRFTGYGLLDQRGMVYIGKDRSATIYAEFYSDEVRDVEETIYLQAWAGYDDKRGFQETAIRLRGSALDVEEKTVPTPESLELTAIYPNPFNNSASVSFITPYTGAYRVGLYDLTGKQWSEVKGESHPGENRFGLDGSALPTGIYYLKLEQGMGSATMKAVLVR